MDDEEDEHGVSDQGGDSLRAPPPFAIATKGFPVGHMILPIAKVRNEIPFFFRHRLQ